MKLRFTALNALPHVTADFDPAESPRALGIEVAPVLALTSQCMRASGTSVQWM